MKSFFKRIAFFSSINSLSLVLAFVNAILLVRILGSSSYGIYSYMSAITAIIPTFFEFVDRTIVRFLGSAESNQQKSIFVFVITVKIILMAVILSIFGGWCYFLMDHKTAEILSKTPEYKFLFVSLILYIPIHMFASTFASTLNALEQYMMLGSGRMARPVIYLIALLFLSFLKASTAIVIVSLAIYIMASEILTVAFSSYALSRAGWWRKIGTVQNVPNMYGFVYHKYFKIYTMPMSSGIFFQYAKTYLPSILLGHAISFESVTYFKVFQNLFDVVRKFIPKIVDVVLPSLVKYKEKNEELFMKNYLKLTSYYIALIGLFSCCMMVAYPIYLKILNVDSDINTSTYVLMFGVNSLVAGMNFEVNYRYILENDIRHFYLLSVVSYSIYIFLLIKLLPLGVMGVLWAECARQGSWLLIELYISIKDMGKNAFPYWRMFATSGFFCLVLLILK